MNSLLYLMENIKLNTDLQNKVLSLNLNYISNLANKCKKSFDVLIKENDIVRLGVCLYYAENFTKQLYIKKRILLDIFYDTMSDITIWCENNKNNGLKNYNWIKNHLNLDLFKLGRLQFQMFKCNNPTLKYNRLPFKKGENILYVHIPQGEKLIYSKCVESLLISRDFFVKYFDYEFEYYFCKSWLLYSENFLFMAPSSNILQFQSLFDVIYSINDDKQAIERIFDKKHLIKSKYPENTSLQRQAKAFIKAGNKLGIGVGVISKYDI